MGIRAMEEPWEKLASSHGAFLKSANGAELREPPRKLHNIVQHGWTATPLLISCPERSEKGGARPRQTDRFSFVYLHFSMRAGDEGLIYSSIVGGMDAWA